MGLHHAIVRRMPALETLASVEHVCSDKTGTLTMGQMTSQRLIIGDQSYSVAGEGLDPSGSVISEDSGRRLFFGSNEERNFDDPACMSSYSFFFLLLTIIMIIMVIFIYLQ